MKRPKAKPPQFKRGQLVRTKHFVAGVPVGISAEMMVEILEVSPQREQARYKISYCGGAPLWVYEDALEALG